MPVRILVVDDEADICQLIKSGLERRGAYHVVTAASGKEALKLARQCKPDLILLDIRLPDMNGIEVLRALKKTFPLSHTPVLMLSGMADGDIRRQCNYEYCEEFLDKPVKLSELQERIESVLSRSGPPPR